MPVLPARGQPVIDGLGFSGLTLPTFPERGEIVLTGARAWSWQDGQVTRVLLDRQVEVTLGPYTYRARKAVVWLEPVLVGSQEADQVAVYMQDASGGLASEALAAQEGDRLLVTGIILNSGARLRPDILEPSRPDDPFVREGEQRLARYLRGVLRQTGQSFPREPSATERVLASLPPDDRGSMAPAERSAAIVPVDGVFAFAPGGDIVLTREDDGAWAAIASGGFTAQYTRITESGGIEGAGGSRSVELRAQDAVVFFEPDADPNAARFDLGAIRGVYLEGDVNIASSGYALRGSKIYYDVLTEQAIILDGVFWAYDSRRGMPLYVRADAIRQEAQNQWTAQNVTLANTGFAEPHFSIGARQVTITRAPADPVAGTRERNYADAEHVTFMAGNVPLFWWPRVRGEVTRYAIEEVKVGSLRGSPLIATSWDMYTLLGLDPAEGNRASLLLDGYLDRGFAIGADLDWRTNEAEGSLFGYYMFDNGTDKLPSGGEIDQDNEHRGLVMAEQIWRLNDNWTLFLEGAWVSDETFVPAFFRDLAEEGREFTNSAYARRLDDRSLLSAELRGPFTDFAVNQYQLQSLGYQVEKLPELTYARVGDNLFGSLFSYTSETRYSRMRLHFTEPTMEELGFQTDRDAEAVFGIGADESIGDALRDQGLNEDTVNRLDTRHAIEMPLSAGALNIVPFAVGRLTLYDTDFDDFTTAAGETESNDSLRAWGSVGVRLATTLQKVDQGVESRFWDLHQIRHLIEPSVTVWTSDTNVDQEDLPVYDESVESIASGTSIRAGIRNTWQTKRGPAGARRSVDWLVIDTDYVWSSNNVDPESPYGRFNESRPESSNLGEFVDNDLILRLTGALTLSSSLVYDVAERSTARLSGGAVVDHGNGFRSYLEYRYLEEPDSEVLQFGAAYELTRRYAASASIDYELDEDDFQDLGFRVMRRFPQVTVEVGVDFDNIGDEVSIGFSVRPVGARGETRSRVFTRDLYERETGQPAPMGASRLESGPFGGS